MLLLSNRGVQAGGTTAAFTAAFEPDSSKLAIATVKRSRSGYAVSGLAADLSDDQAANALGALFLGPKPVLLFLHGNSNTPAQCMERCLRLEETYGVAVVGFSWPAEGLQADGSDLPCLPPVRRGSPQGDAASLAALTPQVLEREGWAQRTKRQYLQAKQNAQMSTHALARVLRLMAVARPLAHAQPMSLAAHSLGSHLLQKTLTAPGALEAIGAFHNISLLAPCCRASGHAEWVGRMAPVGRVYITHNAADTVLWGAKLADGEQGQKLGAEPGELLLHPPVRYLSFTNAKLPALGHTYFVAEAGSKLPVAHEKLFARLFNSQADINASRGEAPRKVYPLGCNADGSMCFMAAPNAPELIGGPS